MKEEIRVKYPHLLRFGIGVTQLLLTIYVYYNFIPLNVLLYIIAILKLEKIKDSIIFE
jgi:hypothetical protein